MHSFFRTDIATRSHRGKLFGILLSGVLCVGSLHGTALWAQEKAGAKSPRPLVPMRVSSAMVPSADALLDVLEGPVHALRTVKGVTKFTADLRAADKARREQMEREEAEKDGDKAAKERGKKQPGEGPEGEEDEPAGEYLDALLYRLKMKAGPDGYIDPVTRLEALRHRGKMPVSPSFRGVKAGGQAKTVGAASRLVGSAAWTFIGPTKLPTPYQIYYGPPGSFTSGRVNGIAYDRTTPGVAYLTGAQGGVWKTTDGGKNWTPLGDKWPTLFSSAVAVNPKDGNLVYVGLGDYDAFDGGEVAGIMRSKDAGVTWERLGAGTFNFESVSGIAIDPENPDVIVATSGHTGAGHIWRSTDGGNSWKNVSPSAGGSWSGVTFNAQNLTTKERWYYAARENDGVYRSTDRGATWQKLNAPLVYNNPASPSFGGLRVAASRVYSRVVYVFDASASAFDARLFKSTDGGGTWTDISGSYPTNAGTFNNFAQAWYDLHLSTAATKVPAPELGPGKMKLIDMIYGGAISLAATADGGPNWTDISFTLTPAARTHNDQHSFAENPFILENALAGNDGGVYGVTYDPSRKVWNIDGSLSATLGITQFYHADWDAKDPNLIIGGTQDNATPQSSSDIDGNPVWRNVGGGDGGGCAIDQENSNVQYTSSQGGVLYGTKDNWSSTFNFAPDWGDTNQVTQISAGPFVGVMATNPAPKLTNYLFYGTQFLWRWDGSNWLNSGGTAPKVKPMGDQKFGGGQVTAIAAAATPLYDANFDIATVLINNAPHRVTAGQVAYVGTDNGEVWVTLNALDPDAVAPATAATKIVWTKISNATLPVRPITSIRVSPNNPGDILVGLGGTGTGHLFRCANTLSPDARFSDQSGFGAARLPDVPLNDITRDPQDPENTFYIATDIGIFTTSDAGSNWADATNPFGLPTIECSAIEATPRAPKGTGLLNIATYGRGMWRIALPDMGPPNITLQQVTVKRLGNDIRVTLSIVNKGTQANDVLIKTATLQSDRGLPVNSTSFDPNSAGLPLGGMAPGAFRIVTLVFPGSVGGRGAAATLALSVGFDGDQAINNRLRTRLP